MNTPSQGRSRTRTWHGIVDLFHAAKQIVVAVLRGSDEAKREDRGREDRGREDRGREGEERQCLDAKTSGLHFWPWIKNIVIVPWELPCAACYVDVATMVYFTQYHKGGGGGEVIE